MDQFNLKLIPHWPICCSVGGEGRAHLPTMQNENASNSHFFGGDYALYHQLKEEKRASPLYSLWKGLICGTLAVYWALTNIQWNSRCLPGQFKKTFCAVWGTNNWMMGCTFVAAVRMYGRAESQPERNTASDSSPIGKHDDPICYKCNGSNHCKGVSDSKMCVEYDSRSMEKVGVLLL